MKSFYLNEVALSARDSGFKKTVYAVAKAAEDCGAWEWEALECGKTLYIGFPRIVDVEAFASLVKDDLEICANHHLSVFTGGLSFSNLHYVRIRINNLRE